MSGPIELDRGQDDPPDLDAVLVVVAQLLTDVADVLEPGDLFNRVMVVRAVVRRARDQL